MNSNSNENLIEDHSCEPNEEAYMREMKFDAMREDMILQGRRNYEN